MPEINHDKHINYIEFPATSAEALGKSRDFFSQVFGWDYKMWGDDYADTSGSGVASGINGTDATAKPVPLPVIYVKNLEETLEHVKKTGAKITKPIFEFPGGRRFHFKEPSGNELAVWSDK